MAKKPIKKVAAPKKKAPAKKTAVKKTAPAKKKIVKELTLEETLKKLKPITSKKVSPKKSVASRYSHLLMPIENFDEEPLKEVAETKEALSKFKYDVKVVGEITPVVESPQIPISEHGTTETNIVYGIDAASELTKLTEKQMNIDLYAISFDIPKQSQESDEVADEDFEEPVNEEYVDEGDIEITPSYEPNKIYGGYIVVIIALLVGSLFLFTDNIKMPTTVTNTVTDTVYKKDTVVLIQTVTDTIWASSTKDDLKKGKEVNYKTARERDSILVELNKNAKPIIVTHQ